MTTIYDVAQRAGVSSSTVSRVFNNSATISQATRERVLAAARELDYQPTVLGSALTTKQTHMVGLTITDIRNPYSASLARGVQDTLTQAGYVCIICNTDADPEREAHVLREIRRRGVDGFIITPSFSGRNPEADRYIRQLLAHRVPIAFVGNRLDDANVDYVTSRAQDGAVQAVNHLAELGHRAIGFIGGRYSRGVAVGRWLGYQEAMIANHLPIQPELMSESDTTPEGGQQAMQRMLELSGPPTAVLAVNDLVAIGAMAACHQRGVAIPGHLSVVGFDDIAMAALTIPALTTVAQPAYEMGAKAAEMLRLRFQQPDLPPQQALLRSSLVVRQSTAPPRG
ncbi:MAG: LacI family transcriptional regulator [Chloroflexota bacterium]|nr:LacI family transcriptional regulator [Chloroflexota bacterium]